MVPILRCRVSHFPRLPLDGFGPLTSHYAIILPLWNGTCAPLEAGHTELVLFYELWTLKNSGSV